MKWHAAALPGGALQHGGDRRLQSSMCVAGHQLDATQATCHEVAQEGQPEGATLTRSDVQPEHLALTARRYRDGDDDRL